MLFIFPILNLFRAQYIDLLREKDIVFFQFNMLLEGHFDNYQNFIRMVKGGVVTGGRQLLGVIFFFIPRQIWPGKPEHSGIVIADNLNLSYSNISVNFFAEGYINFGFIGILLFIIIIAFLNARMDNFFWKKCNGILFNNPLFTCLYLVIFGMEFFILRGALLGAYPITLGLVTAVYITFFLSKGPFLRKTIVKLLIFFTGLKVSPNNNSNGY